MFIVELTYKKSLEDVEQHLVAHRKFLDDGYSKNYFIASGPKSPRTGGIIISSLVDRLQLDNVLKQDPFSIYGIADYTITAFHPTKYHASLENLIMHHS